MQVKAHRGGHGRPATMRDVAELAGVSHQTVSRVLNGHSSVSPPTRARVFAAIEELSYTPSESARALASGRSRTIGVLAVGTHESGPRSMLSEIELIARDRGYDVALADVPTTDEDAISAGWHMLHGRRIAGLMVLTPIDLPPAVVESTATTPVVLMDATASSTSSIASIDQRAGAELTIRHLLSLGHTDFMLITGPQRWNDAALRLDGWTTAIDSAGAHVVHTAVGDWSPTSGHSAVLDAHRGGLKLGHDVTAVVCGNDATAIGALHALRSIGVEVPRDVAVTGFDDLEIAAFVLPPLTTVRQDFRLLARTGIEQLLTHVEHPDATARAQLITPELVVRDSTAGPAAR